MNASQANTWEAFIIFGIIGMFKHEYSKYSNISVFRIH